MTDYKDPAPSDYIDWYGEEVGDPSRCLECGALVDDDGYSIDEIACFYCH